MERTGALDQALQGPDRAWQAQHRGCDRNSSGARQRWRAFKRFLYDGQIEPDSLIAERAIRGFTVGRRNWLFSGNFAAAERSAVVLSIIETCKLSIVDAEAYMADVAERIQNDWPASRWDELMPWNWVRRQDMPLPLAA